MSLVEKRSTGGDPGETVPVWSCLRWACWSSKGAGQEEGLLFGPKSRQSRNSPYGHLSWAALSSHRAHQVNPAAGKGILEVSSRCTVSDRTVQTQRADPAPTSKVGAWNH